MKLNTKKTVYVGAAFFLISAFWVVYDAVMPKILVDHFGLNQTWSGLVMALDNVLALFMLPLFGALSDKTRTRFGRRTPYIVIGTLVACVLFFLASFSDNAQLVNIRDIQNNNTVYTSGVLDDPGLKITDYRLGLRNVQIREAMSEQGLSDEDFIALQPLTDAQAQAGETDYFSVFVKPARSAYAWQQTKAAPSALVAFVITLLFLLIAMSTFRSPAVALMPDVTVKPLRSKGNAVINLMGAVGGILAMGLGIVFATGAAKNIYMSYTYYFLAVIAVMLASLGFYIWKVRENKLRQQMRAESKALGIDEGDDGDAAANETALERADGTDGTEGAAKQDKPVSDSPAKRADGIDKARRRSLLFILASVFLWFMGYNAVTTKVSVYAGAVLDMDYNLMLIIAQAAAIVSFIPIGIISGKIGRKKMIFAGIVMLAAAFGGAVFIGKGVGFLMYAVLALGGMGWASINVNSFPMVVELSKGGSIGKFTGYYYTASMAAQILTPVLSGIFMDNFTLLALFPYAALFAALSFVTMCFVKHGDSKPDAPKGLAAFDN